MSPARTMASPGITYTCMPPAIAPGICVSDSAQIQISSRTPARSAQLHLASVYQRQRPLTQSAAAGMRMKGTGTSSGSRMRPGTATPWRPAHPWHSACHCVRQGGPRRAPPAGAPAARPRTAPRSRQTAPGCAAARRRTGAAPRARAASPAARAGCARRRCRCACPPARMRLMTTAWYWTVHSAASAWHFVLCPQTQIDSPAVARRARKPARACHHKPSSGLSRSLAA